MAHADLPVLERRRNSVRSEPVLDGTRVGACQLGRMLGQDSTGSIWLAHHHVLVRATAMKLLHARLCRHPEVVRRYFGEAIGSTRLADPGIVQIFDAGYHLDGRAYVVMELLHGESLDETLARMGRLDPDHATRLIGQAARTLGSAHAAGIVHRAVTPSNLFVVRDCGAPDGERIKVRNFGDACLLEPIRAETGTGVVVGSPGFMAPEQCRGAGAVDQRTDVYSLGCVLFTLLTGSRPFDARGIGELIALQLVGAVPRPSQLADGISPELDDVVYRCLAKDPEERFASGTELADALDELHRSPSGSIRLRTTIVLPRAQAPRRNRRRWMTAAAAALCVFGGWLALEHRAREPARSLQITDALPGTVRGDRDPGVAAPVEAPATCVAEPAGLDLGTVVIAEPANRPVVDRPPRAQPVARTKSRRPATIKVPAPASAPIEPTAVADFDDDGIPDVR
ncbi:MAG: serine/threonine-protein kinase [Kofleriaceae bacterium]